MARTASDLGKLAGDSEDYLAMRWTVACWLFEDGRQAEVDPILRELAEACPPALGPDHWLTREVREATAA